MLTSSHSFLRILAQIQQGTDPVVDKGLDSAVSFAQSASQWAYITIGASIALLFKDLSQRPKHWLMRCSFLVFLPGWLFVTGLIPAGCLALFLILAYKLKHISQGNL
jgi:hypothetical protein